MTSDRIYLSEMARRLGRASHTVRQWIRRSDFPRELQPQRVTGRQQLFWTPSQFEGMQTYAQAREAARGSFGR